MRTKPLGFIFLLWSGIWQVSADAQEVPSVDLKSLSSVGIVGQYSGISLNPAPEQRASLDSTRGSLIVETNDGVELIGTTSKNGTINALCTLSRGDGSYDMFVGGDFSSIEANSAGRGARTMNIARYDPDQRAFFPLEEGLDGPVLSLYCDEEHDSVYVGGTFSAPLGDKVNASEFGGSAVLWQRKSEEWSALPFRGFNGPVETIVYDKKNATFYFGGKFDATGNGEFGNPRGSQPLNMENAEITAGLSTLRRGFSDPRVVMCSVEPDGPNNTWLLSDNMPGYWRIEFPVTVSPTRVGIKNTVYEGRGTKTFRLISTPDNAVYNLSYADPESGTVQYCNDACPIQQESGEFQEFIITQPIQAQGIQIDILDFYGRGGGLHGVQLYQDDIIVRAAGDFGFPSCADTPFRPEVSVVGEWTQRVLPGVWEYVLQTTVPADELTSSDVSLTLKPFIPATGFYEVTLFTPSCLPVGCSRTTSIEVTLTVAPGRSIVNTLSQRVSQPQRTLLYSGPVVATSNSFAPTVHITIAENTRASTGGDVVIYVGYAEFVRTNGNAPLSGIFQYWPQRNARETEAWGGLADILPQRSTVKSIAVLEDSSLAIGGKFANTTYANIVHYRDGHFVSLAEGGLNGEVNSIYQADNTLIIGGRFTTTSEGKSEGLNNIAQYSISEQEWTSAKSGVNGAVDMVSPYARNDTRRARVFGQFTALAGNNNISYGYAVWNERTSSWSSGGLVVGQVNAVLPSPLANHSEVHVAGKLAAYQKFQAFGGSVLSDKGELAALPIYPKLVNSSVPEVSIYSGSYWKGSDDRNYTSLVIGGEFVLGNVKNIALVKDGALTALDGTLNGLVRVTLIHGDFLFIGGEFTATQGDNTWKNFAIYDLKSNKYEEKIPQLDAQDNKPVQVNTIVLHSESSTVIVGGSFIVSDDESKLLCQVICAWNIKDSKWVAVGPPEDAPSGEAFAIDFIQPKQNTMLVAGNLTVEDTHAFLVSYDFEDEKWQPKISEESQLPGPATTVVNVGSSKKVFIAGTQSNNNRSTYLYFWDGSEFTEISNNSLLAGSRISQLNILETAEHEESNFFDRTHVLSIAGSLQIKDIGNVSVALYDGNQFYSYIVSSQGGGQPGNILGLFFGNNPTAFSESYLSVPVVIIISCLISFGLVFFIVLIGMIIGFFRRRSNVIKEKEQQQAEGRDVHSDQLTKMLLEEAGKRYASAGKAGLFTEKLGDEDQQAQDLPAPQDKDADNAGAAAADQRRTQIVGEGERDSGNSANSDLVLARKVADDLNAGDPVFPVEPVANVSSTQDSSSAAANIGLVSAGTAHDAAASSSDQYMTTTTASDGGGAGYIPGSIAAGIGGGAFQEMFESQVYYAQYPFEAKEEGELHLSLGDQVYVLDTSNDVWWMGTKDDGTGVRVQGVFPSTYVTRERPNLQHQ